MFNDQLIVKGIPVQTSVYSAQEAVVTHAVLELENRSSTSYTITIRQVVCFLGEEICPIDSFFLYRLPDYQELPSSQIELPPSTLDQYEISFAAIAATPYLNQEIQVEVELECNGTEVRSRSPYRISIRTQRA